MIKKEYIAPTMEAVEIEAISMLASSQIKDDENPGGNWGEEPDEELSNRRRNYWKEVGGGW